MGKLDTTLSQAEKMYREMQSLAQRGDLDGKNAIIKLRSRYAMLMLEILQAMKEDPKLQGNPDLKADFEQRFFAMRQKLADHQATWRLQAIEEDTSGYMKSAAGLNTIQEDFYRWVGTNFSLH
ncbi:MAG: hypothetical protein ACO1OD_13700 [Croceibacterium sp.]